MGPTNLGKKKLGPTNLGKKKLGPKIKVKQEEAKNIVPPRYFLIQFLDPTFLDPTISIWS